MSRNRIEGLLTITFIIGLSCGVMLTLAAGLVAGVL